MPETIESFPALAPSVPWFVVLPDSDAGSAVAARLSHLSPLTVAHASGRPWIVGSWPAGEATVARARATTLVVLGHHAVSRPELERAAGRVRCTAELTRLSDRWHGSFHLLASVDGRVRAQGTVLGLRCLFRAQAGAITIAADRADVLAALTGADVDPELLALRVMWPPVLHPVAGRPLWRGVDAVDPADYVLLDPDGRSRTARRWWPPEPALALAEAAAGLRDALSSAVQARVSGGAQITCDLAGLDSTSLCALAARHGARVTALTAENPDPRDDDVEWGRRTAGALPGVEHEVVDVAGMPRFYDRALAIPDRFDEPSSTEMDLARYATMMGRAARHEPRMHLNGFGGDEALQGAVNHLYAMMRSNPRVALGHMRGMRAKFRWSYREIARQLVRDRPYRAWLDAVADSLTEPPPKLQTPLSGLELAAAVRALDHALGRRGGARRDQARRPDRRAACAVARAALRPRGDAQRRPRRAALRPARSPRRSRHVVAVLRRPGRHGGARDAARASPQPLGLQAADRRRDARHRAAGLGRARDEGRLVGRARGWPAGQPRRVAEGRRRLAPGAGRAARRRRAAAHLQPAPASPHPSGPVRRDRELRALAARARAGPTDPREETA